MKRGIELVLLTILVLAVILGIKAFAWVFTTIIYYGVIALCVAAVLYVYLLFKRKRKGGEEE